MSNRNSTRFVVICYLAAAVAANLAATIGGPIASVVSAGSLIGFTITARDTLHDRWSGSFLRLRMGALILTGGAMAIALSLSALRIAIASCIAFVLSESIDWLTFSRLANRPWLVRSNGSNAASSLVDSMVFPTLAFGAIMPEIIAAHIAAKWLGGLAWTLALNRDRSQ